MMQGSAKFEIGDDYTAMFTYLVVVIVVKCQVAGLVLYNLSSLRTAARPTSPSPQNHMAVISSRINCDFSPEIPLGSAHSIFTDTAQRTF
jgi:hypothetical protein